MEIKDLKLNPANPRKITDKKLAALKKSLKEFGDLSGVVYNRHSSQLIGGHQRLKALETIGISDIEYQDQELTYGFINLMNGEKFAYREVDWDEAKEKAANIAANKGAGEWDMDKLGEWFKDLDKLDFDLDLTMFDEDERKDFFKDKGDLPGLTDPDAIPENVDTRCKLGDLWLLGNHRLLCGDSTDVLQVERLMANNRSDIVFTSPPYNVGGTHNYDQKRGTHNYDQKGGHKYENNDDNKTTEEFSNFLTKIVNIWLSVSGFFFENIQGLSGNKIALIEHLYALKDKFADTIIWDKKGAPPSLARKVLNSQFEYVHVFSNIASRAIGEKDFRGTISNLISINSRQDKEYSAVHGATFSVEFVSFFIDNFTEKSCADPFSGTGTTFIACEKSKRDCYGMELDPSYCDIILKRWEDFTGCEAVLSRE